MTVAIRRIGNIALHPRLADAALTSARRRLHARILNGAGAYERIHDLPLLVHTRAEWLASRDPAVTAAICHLLKAAIRQQRALPRPNRERILALLEALIAERRTLRAQHRRTARDWQVLRADLFEIAVMAGILIFALAAIARAP